MNKKNDKSFFSESTDIYTHQLVEEGIPFILLSMHVQIGLESAIRSSFIYTYAFPPFSCLRMGLNQQFHPPIYIYTHTNE